MDLPQNINWAQLIGFLATLFTLFGITIPPDIQKEIVISIVSLTAIATFFFHIFVNHPRNVAAIMSAAATGSTNVATTKS